MLGKTRDLKEVGYRRKNKNRKAKKKLENKEKNLLWEIKNKRTNKQKYECETI